ncbi:MAG: hypothetical protein ABI120_21255, partial [Gemmatimonadaceae bacterium]
VEKGAVFPPLESIRATSVVIAVAVVRVAVEDGLATVDVPEDIEGWVEQRMYQPEYPEIPMERRGVGEQGSGTA